MGWARANIFYDKLSNPPEPGSLQEALCVLIFKAREEYQTMEFAAQLMSTGSKEVSSIFEDYQGIRFPYLELAKEKEQRSAKDLMENVFTKGVYQVDKAEAPRKRVNAKKAKSPFERSKK